MTFLAVIDTTTLIGPILNVGAVGACLIILGIYYLKKDKKYDARIDEQLKAQDQFRKELTDAHKASQTELKELSEKYRLALEKFSQTLDSVVEILQRR